MKLAGLLTVGALAFAFVLGVREETLAIGFALAMLVGFAWLAGSLCVDGPRARSARVLGLVVVVVAIIVARAYWVGGAS